MAEAKVTISKRALHNESVRTGGGGGGGGGAASVNSSSGPAAAGGGGGGGGGGAAASTTDTLGRVAVGGAGGGGGYEAIVSLRYGSKRENTLEHMAPPLPQALAQQQVEGAVEVHRQRNAEQAWRPQEL